MYKLNIKTIAFPGASEELFTRGEKLLEKKLASSGFELLFKKDKAKVLYFLSGGSEQEAVQTIDNSCTYLLIAGKENNASASAAEVKAYLDQSGIINYLVYLDDADAVLQIENYVKSAETLQYLSNVKLGLVGNESGWLVASKVSSDLLKEKFNVKLKQYSWEVLKDFGKQEINPEFIQHFKDKGEYTLNTESKIYNLLQQLISIEELNAISVECFPLAREYKETACLPLSKLNSDGIIAGCEGDLTSTIGMYIAQKLSGELPWMANLNYVASDKVYISHCTVPLEFINKYEVTSHFETGIGTAIKGEVKHRELTLLRFNNTFDKVYVSEGLFRHAEYVEKACRTQLCIELNEEDTSKLKSSPLGNHHIVIPGFHKSSIEFFCKLKKIHII